MPAVDWRAFDVASRSMIIVTPVCVSFCPLVLCLFYPAGSSNFFCVCCSIFTSLEHTLHAPPLFLPCILQSKGKRDRGGNKHGRGSYAVAGDHHTTRRARARREIPVRGHDMIPHCRSHHRLRVSCPPVAAQSPDLASLAMPANVPPSPISHSYHEKKHTRAHQLHKSLPIAKN